VDEKIVYPINELYTLNPDNGRRLAALVSDQARRLQGARRIGYQREETLHSTLNAFRPAASVEDLVEVDEILQELQLRKDPDEIQCIRRAVRATLAGYSRAQQVIRPGITELEVYLECEKAAQASSGEIHYYMGDFRAGVFGGVARNRPIESGELYIIDAWSDLDGYWCDMARTWAVNGEPTELQESVFEHLAAILADVPTMARPGRCTREFWREIDERAREHPHLRSQGLTHHAGHGIGLRVHEGPDLNRDRGGVFEPGNVFTCEPGAYSRELNGGVRVENVFVMGPEGAEVLIPYPNEIRADPNCPVPAGSSI